jgi:hypothetical protein
MKKFVRPKQVAGFLFGLAAAAPIGTWLIFLFGEVPTNRLAFQKAARALSYAVTAPDTLWFFFLLTLLTVLSLALSFVHFARGDEDARPRRLLAVLGATATLIALAIQWPAAIASALGTYYGQKRLEV